MLLPSLVLTSATTLAYLLAFSLPLPKTPLRTFHVNMPLLHDLTIRIKTRFSPSTSPTSPSSFEVITGKRIYNGDGGYGSPPQQIEVKVVGKEIDIKHKHRRMDSFLDEIDGVSVPAHIVLMARAVPVDEKGGFSKGERRRSRFREEFGDDECVDVKL